MIRSIDSNMADAMSTKDTAMDHPFKVGRATIATTNTGL